MSPATAKVRPLYYRALNSICGSKEESEVDKPDSGCLDSSKRSRKQMIFAAFVFTAG